MPNIQRIDPALNVNLRELAEMLREIGADQTTVLRGEEYIAAVRPGNVPPFGPMSYHTTHKDGLVLVIHFPTTDGGDEPIEEI